QRFGFWSWLSKIAARIPFATRRDGFSGSTLTKKPHASSDGAAGGVPSREERSADATREGSLAYGVWADHSGGTAADSHGLPRFPCLQIDIYECKVRIARVSIRGAGVRGSISLPIAQASSMRACTTDARSRCDAGC